MIKILIRMMAAHQHAELRMDGTVPQQICQYAKLFAAMVFEYLPLNHVMMVTKMTIKDVYLIAQVRSQDGTVPEVLKQLKMCVHRNAAMDLECKMKCVMTETLLIM